MNRKGMRVLAVAQKSYIEKVGNFSVSDEKEMVLIGFLAFLIPRNHLRQKLLSNCMSMVWKLKSYRGIMIL